jgi:hypothetical protein
MATKNSESKISRIEGQIRALAEQNSQIFANSLQHSKEIGKLLTDVKTRKLVPHKEFGSWCEKNFGFRSSQRSDYMQLSRDWDLLPLARQRAQSNQERFDDQTLSGVMRLLRAYKRGNGPKREKSRAKTMAELVALLAALEEQHGTNFEIPTKEADLVKKIYATWAHPATEIGPANNAKEKISEFAAKRRMSVRVYLAALGLKVPVNRNIGADLSLSCLQGPS